MNEMRVDELKGCWALVTGASSGIGREFAIQLAARGVNLALVARRANRLEALSLELSTHGIRALPLPADLAQPGVALVLRQRLRDEGVRIRLLCNMAAIGRWAAFEASPSELYEQMIQVNVTGVVSMCREFLPDLASHPSSAIINASSPAAYQPVPYMAVYGATKAFVHSFSQALYAEYAGKRVLVQTLVPGPASTELEGASAVATGQRSPAEIVRSSLANLAKGVPIVVTAKGTVRQRLFAMLPARVVLGQVARMFRPRK
jgi:short-subunit dehydrogenase